MKKLINRPEQVVPEMLEGLLWLSPGAGKLAGFNVIVRTDAHEVRDKQVALISGGGSGHEPAHAGYVGSGMLSAAVAGEVFTSPSVDAIYAAIKEVTGKQGALLIVKNYTGDRLNFGLAAEMARAEGHDIGTVIVADDVALCDINDNVGRRGIAGTVLVHKIAGAAAAAGLGLDQVADIAQRVAESVATMGISLSGGIVPAAGKPNFLLSESEVELGLGIHGEPGVRRVQMKSADELVDQLIAPIVSAQRLRAGDRIAVLINNLGSTTNMELAIVARRACSLLASRGMTIERVYSGPFMTSLETAGVSISVLRVDDDRLSRLDAPTSAPAWPNRTQDPLVPLEDRIFPSAQVPRYLEFQAAPESSTGQKLRKAAEAACRALLEAEPFLTELDQSVGDGDLGISLARGARAVLDNFNKLAFDKPAETLKSIAALLRESVGGSSGPLYGVMLLRAAAALDQCAQIDASAWSSAAKQAGEAISELGGARVGDRTMLDALVPFAESLEAGLKSGPSPSEALKTALHASEEAANATAQILPKRGRASYLGKRAIGHPDPGAQAVVIWLRAIVDAVA